MTPPRLRPFDDSKVYNASLTFWLRCDHCPSEIRVKMRDLFMAFGTAEGILCRICGQRTILENER